MVSPRSRTLVACATLAVGLALAGCAGRGGPRPGSPVPAAPAAGYERTRDAPDSLHAAAVAGRRVALDPGHGGYFRGSLGVGGLAEADVNLGVALRLADRLRAAGADVFLTRETDRDFLSPADSTLRADLAERMRLANAFAADVFVSIHHNADAAGRHDVNETQTYWKLDDDGASYEAAADVHRALVRNVGIAADRLLPGNYAVLRLSDAPGMLTESSHLTYPPTEARLRDPAALAIEADALFVGLARWFQRRGPVVRFFEVDTTGSPPSALQLRAGIEGEFDAVDWLVDGAPVQPARYAQSLTWPVPPDVAEGVHEGRVRARLAGSGTSAWRRIEFEIVRRAERLELDTPYQEAWWSGDEALAVRVRAADAAGQPVRRAPMRVRVRAAGGARPADTTIVLADGEGWAYLARAGRAGAREVTLGAEATTPGVRGATLRVPAHAGVRAIECAGFARGPEGGRIAPGPTPAPDAVCNRDGFGRFRRFVAFAGATAPEWTPGWRRVPLDDEHGATGAATLTRASGFVAWFAGALHGRRIALDPAGDGDGPGGARPARSPSGTRAADVNLEVARALEGMLRACGAQVELVRDGPAPVLDPDRVRRAERFGAERYLRIARAADAPRVVAYVGSASGRRWAGALLAASDSLGDPRPALAEGADWVLQQTSCPALLAELEPLPDLRPDPAAVRREAYRLLVATAREFAPAASWTRARVEWLDPDGGPRAGLPVTLGDALVLVTDAQGGVDYLRTEPGGIMVSARSALEAHRGVHSTSERVLRFRDSH